jgi:hypothetical protein
MIRFVKLAIILLLRHGGDGSRAVVALPQPAGEQGSRRLERPAGGHHPGTLALAARRTRHDCRRLASGRVRIDEDLLIAAVLRLNAAERPVRSDTVSIELGPIADDGGHWDVRTVADDLAELESLGMLERAPAFVWEGVSSPPKTIIAYALRGDE